MVRLLIVRLLMTVTLVAVALGGAVSSAEAQRPRPPQPAERGGEARPGGDARTSEGTVPKEHMPPPGMCRIWLDGVPATQQPAPTDCPTAIRNRPPNGKVVFGPRENRRADDKEPPVVKTDLRGTTRPPVRIRIPPIG